VIECQNRGYTRQFVETVNARYEPTCDKHCYVSGFENESKLRNGSADECVRYFATPTPHPLSMFHGPSRCLTGYHDANGNCVLCEFCCNLDHWLFTVRGGTT
jgi:hypothetical protein